jgi:hypothetical protein
MAELAHSANLRSFCSHPKAFLVQTALPFAFSLPSFLPMNQLAVQFWKRAPDRAEPERGEQRKPQQATGDSMHFESRSFLKLLMLCVV